MAENISADIPADLVRADEVLTQYGRWAAGRPTRHRCGSAERDYRPEAWQAVEARRTPKGLGLSLHEALTAQRALASVPDRERAVLVVLYVPRRMPPEVQLRLLRIPAKLSRERHLLGLRMFDNLFRIAVHSRAPDAGSVHLDG